MTTGDALLEAAVHRHRAAGHWRGLGLHELTEEALRTAPAMTVSTLREKTSLAELAEHAERLAGRLSAVAGITAGDRVFLVLSDAIGDIALLLALARLDAVVFFAPPGQAVREAERMLERSSAAIVVAGPSGAAPARALAAGVPGGRAAIADRRSGDVVAVAGDGVAPVPGERSRITGRTRFVTFTSGTTGEPKGIQHNADTLAYAGRWAVELAGPAPGALLAIISIAHAAGLAFSLLSALAHGRDLAIHQGRWDPAAVVDLAELRGATYTLCTTTHLLDLVEEVERRGTRPGLTVSVGGAAVDPGLIRRADAAGVTACRIFGLSECPGHTSTRGGDPLELRMHTEGEAYPGTDVVGLDADGRPLPEGTPGEAGCRGPSLFLGYLGERSVADRLTADGFFRTGDLVRVDDGRLTVLGRLKDIVIRGGQNIDPVEVEQSLLGAPGVARAAVVGVPDARLGERLGAAVQLRGSNEGGIDAVLEHLASAGVPKYKWPERWQVVEALPLDRTGKVDKRCIREALAEEARCGSSS